MPTLVYNTGFEHGTLSTNGEGLATSLVGNYELSSTIKRTGNYAVRVYGAWSYVAMNIGAVSTRVGRFYVLFHSWPASGTTHFGVVGGGTDLFWLTFDSDNKKIGIKTYGGTASYADVVCSLDTWYRVDFKCVFGSPTSTGDIQVNGTAATQATGEALSGSDDSFRFFSDSADADYYFDDLAYSHTADDYPIGPGQGIGLSPSGTGTSNTGTNIIEDNTGGDINDSTNPPAQYLDDVPISTATDYIKQSAVGTGNYFETPFASIGPGTIKGARAILAYRASGESGDQGACIVSRDGSFDTYDEIWGNPTTRADYSESSVFYKSKQLSIPTGGWSRDAVNALKVRGGYSNDVEDVPYWVNLMIEVDYIPMLDYIRLRHMK